MLLIVKMIMVVLYEKLPTTWVLFLSLSHTQKQILSLHRQNKKHKLLKKKNLKINKIRHQLQTGKYHYHPQILNVIKVRIISLQLFLRIHLIETNLLFYSNLIQSQMWSQDKDKQILFFPEIYIMSVKHFPEDSRACFP